MSEIYRPINRVELMNSGNIVKEGDIFKLQYKLFGVDNNPVDVSGMQIAVKIANKRAIVYETTAIAVAEGTVEFEVSESIGHGEMYIELKVSDGTVAVQRYPAEDWLKIRVTPSLDSIELYGVTTVSVEQLKNELRQIQFDYEAIVDEKIEDMEYTVQISGIDSYEALLTAKSANTKSTNAVNVANEAKLTADTVRDEFDQVVVEVDAATENANMIINNWKYIGVYSTATQYEKHNVVTVDGESYIAKQDNINQFPVGDSNDLYWSTFARKGEDGTGTTVVYKDEFTATANQMVFTLSNSYTPLTNRLRVIVDGVEQFTPSNFTETANNKFTMRSGLAVGQEVIAVYFSQAPTLANDFAEQLDQMNTHIQTELLLGTIVKSSTAPSTDAVFWLDTSVE